jgi:parvulin-like peptidyl-prolyl isomerase
MARENQKVHVRQIFIRVAPSPEQMKKIADLLDSLRINCKTAADFIAAVRNYSTDKSSKARDGCLGWKSVLDLAAPVRAAIDTLHPGSVTPVVNDVNELAIYRIDDRVNERLLTLADDWQVLTEKAQDIMAQKKLVELVSRWRHQIYINVRM